jgi:hypothetical protein
MAQIRVILARDQANLEQKLVTLLLAAIEEKPDLIISVFAGIPALGAYRLLVGRSRSKFVDFSQVRFVVFDELFFSAAISGADAVQGAFASRVPPSFVQRWTRGFLSRWPSRRTTLSPPPFFGPCCPDGTDLQLPRRLGHRHCASVGGLTRTYRIPCDRIQPPVRLRHREGGEPCPMGRTRGVLTGPHRPRRATRMLLFAAGRNFAEIVQRITEGTFEPSVPISVLQRYGNVILVADSGASSRISREERIQACNLHFSL